MYSPYVLKRYIKNELKYAIKKAWSRPPKYWQPSIKSTKGLFWTELLRMVHERQIIFNVDECCFNRALKMDYSWLPVGRSSSVINDTWKGRASLILSVGSNSQWFGVIKTGTVNSKAFCIFLDLLEKVLMKTRCNGRFTPVVILDNAKVHTSNYTKAVMSSLELKVRPLPPYCPEVAPVEPVFRAVKAKMRSRSPARIVDFSKQSGMEAIRDCLLNTSRRTIQDSWAEVVEEWSEGIRSAVTELNLKNVQGKRRRKRFWLDLNPHCNEKIEFNSHHSIIFR